MAPVSDLVWVPENDQELQKELLRLLAAVAPSEAFCAQLIAATEARQSNSLARVKVYNPDVVVGLAFPELSELKQSLQPALLIQQRLVVCWLRTLLTVYAHSQDKKIALNQRCDPCDTPGGFGLYLQTQGIPLRSWHLVYWHDIHGQLDTNQVTSFSIELAKQVKAKVKQESEGLYIWRTNRGSLRIIAEAGEESFSRYYLVHNVNLA
jgi:hypothetical protein